MARVIDMSKAVSVKVSELDGVALSWAIANIEGVAVEIQLPPNHEGWLGFRNDGEFDLYAPHERWDQIGPLIEKYGVDLSAPPCIDRNREIGWQARPDDGESYWRSGETPLIAACRAIVAAKLGETVLVPKELIK